MINLNNQDKRLTFFLLGFFGLSLISFTYRLLDVYPVIFNIIDINLIPNHTNFFNNYTGIANYLIYSSVFILIILTLGKNEFDKIFTSFKKKDTYSDGITYGILIILVSLLVGILIDFIKKTEINANQNAVNDMVFANPFLSFITIVIIGPIVEEFTYRFGLFGYLKDINKKLAYAVTIILFALIHFEFTTDLNDLINELLNLPSYLIGAIILSIAYDKSDNLATPIIAHIFNNLISFIMLMI